MSRVNKFICFCKNSLIFVRIFTFTPTTFTESTFLSNDKNMRSIRKRKMLVAL